MDILLAWDRKIFLGINGWNHKWLDPVLAWPTFLGENWIAIPLALLGIWIWDRRGALRKSAVLVAAAGAACAAIQLLKILLARPRPYDFFAEEAVQGKVFVHYIFDPPDSSSLPSGHAGLTFAVAVTLNYLYPGRFKALYPLALLISVSRVYVGAHFPSDVLAGALIGILMSLLTIRLIQRYFPKWISGKA